MADAWTNLLAHSSLPATGHDAWEHLLAQEGGGSIVYLDRYVSDKFLTFKVESKQIQFTMVQNMKFNMEPVTTNFTKEFKTFKINKKEVKIVFKAQQVID